MAKNLRIEETAEGYIAYCHGDSSPFSFLAGQHELSVSEIHGNYLFSTKASHAPYVLQFIWPDLDKSTAGLSSEHDIEILVGYCRWEMNYQEQTLRRRLVPESASVLKLPTGRQFITWYSEVIGETATAALGYSAEGTQSSSPDDLTATPFSGFSCLRNGSELIVFGIQGLGSGWTQESVRLKAMRIAFSTFFE